MLIYWALIKKFWWLLPVTALCITAGVYRIERDRARTQVAALQSRLTSLEDITAANAAKALTEGGLGAATTHGFAETRPVEPNTTEAGRAKNRRVEVRVTR